MSSSPGRTRIDQQHGHPQPDRYTVYYDARNPSGRPWSVVDARDGGALAHFYQERTALAVRLAQEDRATDADREHARHCIQQDAPDTNTQPKEQTQP